MNTYKYYFFLQEVVFLAIVMMLLLCIIDHDTPPLPIHISVSYYYVTVSNKLSLHKKIMLLLHQDEY
jgi:hypothetical protein